MNNDIAMKLNIPTVEELSNQHKQIQSKELDTVLIQLESSIRTSNSFPIQIHVCELQPWQKNKIQDLVLSVDKKYKVFFTLERNKKLRNHFPGGFYEEKHTVITIDISQ